MKVFKWVLIVFGSLVLMLVAVIVGWLATIETVKLTAADLDVGGSYPVEERQALFDACKSNRENEAFDDEVCTCLADNAGKKLSRFERLTLAATFEEDATKIVALVKGMALSGVPQDKLDESEAKFEQRLKAVFDSCGLSS